LGAQEILNSITDNIKGIFSSGSKSLIGIDIGLSAVKIAEIKKSGSSYKLVGFAKVDLPEGALIDDEIQISSEIVSAIEKGVKKIKTQTLDVCLGLSGPNTVARKLQLAGGSFEDIEDQVQWESEQYLPFPIDDSSLSFHVFGENEGGGVDVLVAAARNDLVESFKEVVETAKLKVKVVDLNVVAMINVFENVYFKDLVDPNVSWLIIDIGAQRTDFVIYKQNSIAFTKEMNIGGSMITEEIQRQMGVNYNEAEDLKMTTDEAGNLPEEIVEIIDDILETFFEEIKKTVDFYVTSTSDDNIRECVLTGGGALIPGIVHGVENLIGLNVSILNPFNTFSYDKKRIPEDQVQEIAFRGVAALGLAMRESSK
jgi:type IV pilus assembly protein PilM